MTYISHTCAPFQRVCTVLHTTYTYTHIVVEHAGSAFHANVHYNNNNNRVMFMYLFNHRKLLMSLLFVIFFIKNNVALTYLEVGLYLNTSQHY